MHSELREELQRNWVSLWGASSAPAFQMASRLMDRYSSPWRHFYTLEYLSNCLRHLRQVRGLAVSLRLVRLAVWFHKAYADPKRSDNEERSAELAAKELAELGMEQADIDVVERLILATKQDRPGEDGDQKLIADLCIRIFGAPREEFLAHEAAIRSDNSFLSKEKYADGRKLVLEMFLERPSVYQLEFFHARYEVPARENLASLLVRLERGM